MAEEQNWFPYGPNGDYGISWVEAGIKPPATLKEYWETYHPCNCENICEKCV